MSRELKSTALVLLALAGGATGDHFVFDDSSSSSIDCSVRIADVTATIESAGGIGGCEGVSGAWMARIEELVEQVRAEIAELEIRIAEEE